MGGCLKYLLIAIVVLILLANVNISEILWMLLLAIGLPFVLIVLLPALVSLIRGVFKGQKQSTPQGLSRYCFYRRPKNMPAVPPPDYDPSDDYDDDEITGDVIYSLLHPDEQHWSDLRHRWMDDDADLHGTPKNTLKALFGGRRALMWPPLRFDDEFDYDFFEFENDEDYKRLHPSGQYWDESLNKWIDRFFDEENDRSFQKRVWRIVRKKKRKGLPLYS